MVNTIFNWAIVAIVSSFTFMPASVNRQAAPTAESVTEEAALKGCNTFFKEGLVPFYFDSDDYSKPAVEDESLWKPGTHPQNDCSTNQDEVACVIYVDPSFVSGNILLSTIELQAAEFDIDHYYVESSDDPEMVPFNRQQ